MTKETKQDQKRINLMKLDRQISQTVRKLDAATKIVREQNRKHEKQHELSVTCVKSSLSDH